MIFGINFSLWFSTHLPNSLIGPKNCLLSVTLPYLFFWHADYDGCADVKGTDAMILVNDDVDEDELMMIIMSFDDDREGILWVIYFIPGTE